jgi:hypothetical protein
MHCWSDPKVPVWGHDTLALTRFWVKHLVDLQFCFSMSSMMKESGSNQALPPPLNLAPENQKRLFGCCQEGPVLETMQVYLRSALETKQRIADCSMLKLMILD